MLRIDLDAGVKDALGLVFWEGKVAERVSGGIKRRGGWGNRVVRWRGEKSELGMI